MFEIILGIMILILLPVVLYLDAQARMHFTFPEEGMITAFLRGNNFWKFAVRIQEEGRFYDYNPETGRLDNGRREERDPETGDVNVTYDEHIKDPRSFLERWIGAYFISVLYPFKKQHSIEIDARSLRKEGLSEVKNVTDMVTSRKKRIPALRWKFPRPVVIKDVELKDRSRIDIIVFMTFQVTRPYLPFFVFQGDFFELLDSAVESAVIDFCRDFTYVGFQELAKGKRGKAGSEEGVSHEDVEAFSFTQRLLQINRIGEVVDAPNGIEEAVGIEASDGYIFRYGLSEDLKEIENAAQAKEIAVLEADAVREKAKGERDAIHTVAFAEGSRFRRLLASQVRFGVSPDAASESMRSILTAEQVSSEKSAITTWVADGGSSKTFVGVGADQSGRSQQKPNSSES